MAQVESIVTETAGHATQQQSTPQGDHSRRDWRDLAVLVVLAGVVFGIIALAARWRAAPVAVPEPINLSMTALPLYALCSLARIVLSATLAVVFAIAFGYWTVRDPVADQYVTPLLDHARRTIPAAGFLPLLAVGLVGVLPYGNLGLELATLLALFLSQMWPIANGFRHALKAVPPRLLEMAAVFHFSNTRRFRQVELPYGTTGLVWNTMFGTARAWFVLIAAETIIKKMTGHYLPGLGAYLSEAVDQQRYDAAGWAIATMVLLILSLDMFLWRPLIVWAQKYRFDEQSADEGETSWVLTYFRSTRLYRWLVGGGRKHHGAAPVLKAARRAVKRLPRVWPGRLSVVILVVAALPLAYGAVQLVLLLSNVSLEKWGELLLGAIVSLGRVLLTLTVATLVWLPIGASLGLSPRLSRWAEPITLLAASFPATLLFPLALKGLQGAGVARGWGVVLMMLLAAQWYILFNVLAGASAVPSDLREAVKAFRLPWWRRLTTFQAPAVFPALVQGWDSAAGLAWNTSLLVEMLAPDEEKMIGLGYEIGRATQAKDYAVVAAGLLILATILECFSRFVWRRLNALARTRYTVGR